MDIVELLPRLHFLRFPVGHVYLWEDPEALTLIDTGVPGSGPDIAEAIRSLGRSTEDVRRIVLTHFHEDHVGSAAGWGGAEVVAHHADAAVIRGDLPGPPPRLLDWERPIFEQVRTHVPAQRPDPVPVEVTDGDVLDFGGGARVVAVPGHTAGSMALFLPEDGVLLTGDAAARAPDGRVMSSVFNIDPEGAVASFRRLAEFECEVACFGHGEPLTRSAGVELRAAAERIG